MNKFLSWVLILVGISSVFCTMVYCTRVLGLSDKEVSNILFIEGLAIVSCMLSLGYSIEN